MFDCPSCAANLRFDPATQDMGCPYCGSHYDVGMFRDDKGNAESSEIFDVTVFTCPQCGGELISTDNEAAVFCSYCGASNVLESKLRQEKRPKYIIPFSVTKDDCKKRFTAKVKRTGFAPAELTDPEVIESFRGIYMPYWCYSVKQDNDIIVHSTDVRQEGDYEVTRTYTANARVDASYGGYAKDSASSFDDEISDSIAPYDRNTAKDFHSAYMSGFYADISDVDKQVYEQEAKDLAVRETRNRVSTELNRAKMKGSPDTSKLTDRSLNTRVTEVENVMYPVWFFSYRSGDRVAYAAVNGQTGKLMADVPISTKKYYLASFLMAIPIFVLLNLFLTIHPKYILMAASVLTIITVVMSFFSSQAVYEREHKTKDLGWLSKNRPNEEIPKYSPVTWDEILGIVLAVLDWAVIIFAPVSDLWYYGTIVLNLIIMLLLIIRMIKEFNLMSTHKLPQFNRTGGDDRA
ncbi:MAG: hypothetical protein KBT01_09520 [Clostridiales bacterium]|nr:hypothetical protein [Candidatus Blautia equi]